MHKQSTLCHTAGFSRDVEPLQLPLTATKNSTMASSHVKGFPLHKTVLANSSYEYLLSVCRFHREPFAVNLFCDGKATNECTSLPYSRRDLWVYPPRSGKDF